MVTQLFVQVSIEDVSYAPESIETGRSVYSVILCDRGPSDQIVRVRSQEQFQNTFGRPNFLRTSQTHYMVNAALAYTGDVLVTRVVPDDAYWANSAIQENTTGEIIKALFDFRPDEKIVRVYPSGDVFGASAIYSENDIMAELEKIQVGSWIYADGDDPEYAAQVVNKVEDEENEGAIILTLDRPYGGGDHTGTAYLFTPFSEISLSDINDVNLFSNPQGDIVYYFYANGAGKYYNNLLIRGTRNTDLEKYIIYDDGTPRYKYLFMDIAIYEQQANGNQKLLEGPWTVSLIPRYPDEEGRATRS